eukprot:3608763-Pyramimonas_sp.AAC.1
MAGGIRSERPTSRENLFQGEPGTPSAPKKCRWQDLLVDHTYILCRQGCGESRVNPYTYHSTPTELAISIRSTAAADGIVVRSYPAGALPVRRWPDAFGILSDALFQNKIKV